MRIIGGRNKRKTINPPSNFRARPTTDFAKENLFNIIGNNFDFEEVEVLDLFSGTGSISYEFASRGASRVVSVELNLLHHKFIAATARDLGYVQMAVIRTNVFVYLRSIKDSFDIIFADPPYELEGIEQIPEMIFSRGLLRPGGWLILEHSSAKDFSENEHFLEVRRYGSVNFSIFTI